MSQKQGVIKLIPKKDAEPYYVYTYINLNCFLISARVTQTLDKERCIKEQIYFELLYVVAFGSPVKVTSNLRGCPPEKKFAHALFSRKPPQTIYQQKGYKM